jgi:hypothetical protein
MEGRWRSTSLTPVTAAPSPSDRPSSHSVDRSRWVASTVCGLQGLFLLGFCVFSLVELASSGSDSPTRVVMEVVLVALFALGLLVIARFWVAGADWPKTPTVVWNLLLVPVAWGLVQSGRGLIALAVAVVALTGIVSAATAGTSNPE